MPDLRPARRVVIAATAFMVACGGGATGNKAGGSERVTLRMANTAIKVDGVPAVKYFVDRLQDESRSNVSVLVVNEYDHYLPEAEQQIVRDVAAGKIDLAWVGSRVFDTLGVKSFQALTLPMLVDSYALEKATIESSIPAQMMRGLDALGVAGLGVLADGLRKPIGVKKPIVGAADWRGIRFGTLRSAAQSAAIRALGAIPTEVFGSRRTTALTSGTLGGFEMSLLTYDDLAWIPPAPYVTVNVNLWPQMDVLIANPSRLRELTAEQRDWLHRAADDSVKHSTTLGAKDPGLLREACSKGTHAVNASAADLEALRRGTAGAYADLVNDPVTKAFAARIEALKHATHPESSPTIPSGCASL